MFREFHALPRVRKETLFPVSFLNCDDSIGSWEESFHSKVVVLNYVKSTRYNEKNKATASFHERLWRSFLLLIIWLEFVGDITGALIG